MSVRAAIKKLHFVIHRALIVITSAREEFFNMFHQWGEGLPGVQPENSNLDG